MSGTILSKKLLATSMLVVASAACTYAVKRRISLVDPANIAFSSDIPASFKQSNTVTKILNVNNHPLMVDTRSTTIELPSRFKDVSDEVLLAKFVKGFFGGLVFAPERVVLQTMKKKLVTFQGIEPTGQMWSKEDLPDDKLLPLHLVGFGGFQVLDINLAPRSATPTEQSTESYVDIAFGNNHSHFTGSHRFVVERLPQSPGSASETVKVHLHCLVCDAVENRQVFPGWFHTFHNVYALFLFRDAVSDIKRWLAS